jgi:hypothetical protein
MHEGLSLEKAVTSFFLVRDRKGWGGGGKESKKGEEEAKSQGTHPYGSCEIWVKIVGILRFSFVECVLPNNLKGEEIPDLT